MQTPTPTETDYTHYDGAVIYDEDGIPVATIQEIISSGGRTRFKTLDHRDDTIYNGLAHRVLENIQDAGWTINTDQKGEN